MATKKAAKKTAAKKTAKTEKPKTLGKLAVFHASKLVLNKKEMPTNPGREGSKAHKYRAVYYKVSGKTVAEAIKAGAHAGYIRGDVKRGYLSLTPPKAA